MKMGEKQILAWLDGELDEAGAREVEQAVQADPALMARAEAHFLAMMQLKAAFAPLLDAPFPSGPGEAAPVIATPSEQGEETFGEEEPPAETVAAQHSPSLQERVVALARPARRRWGLVAAALVLGLLIGRFLLGTTSGLAPTHLADFAPAQGAIARDQDGTLVAAGALSDALENGVEPGDSTAIRVPLSFRDKSGKLCRSFDTARLAGIACRDDDGWRLRLALQTSSSGRSAASESPFVGQAVDAMIAGDPLDAGQQQAARDRGWR
jgi:anti-sigma factor RsiW